MTYKNKKYGPTKTAPKTSKRKWWVASLFVAVVLLLGFGVYWQFIRDRHKTPAVSATADTKGDNPTSNTGSTSGTAVNGNATGNTGTSGQAAPPTSSDNKQAPTTPATNAALLTPSGNFVSSHVNVPRNAPLSSVCTTTPGANCNITFTQGSTTKALPAQTTDKGGSTYWNQWKPQDYGLTAGSWTITATASLNGQTKSATDGMALQIAP